MAATRRVAMVQSLRSIRPNLGKGRPDLKKSHCNLGWVERNDSRTLSITWRARSACDQARLFSKNTLFAADGVHCRLAALLRARLTFCTAQLWSRGHPDAADRVSPSPAVRAQDGPSKATPTCRWRLAFAAGDRFQTLRGVCEPSQISFLPFDRFRSPSLQLDRLIVPIPIEPCAPHFVNRLMLYPAEIYRYAEADVKVAQGFERVDHHFSIELRHSPP